MKQFHKSINSSSSPLFFGFDLGACHGCVHLDQPLMLPSPAKILTAACLQDHGRHQPGRRDPVREHLGQPEDRPGGYVVGRGHRGAAGHRHGGAAGLSCSQNPCSTSSARSRAGLDSADDPLAGIGYSSRWESSFRRLHQRHRELLDRHPAHQPGAPVGGASIWRHQPPAAVQGGDPHPLPMIFTGLRLAGLSWVALVSLNCWPPPAAWAS